MIPYGRQSISEQDIQAVVDVLRSDFLTQGPAVPTFEKAVATHCGAMHAVATNSATSALHIACLAIGVDKGDIVWTSPITFVASANCALYCGAEVDFVDIDPQTYNISVEQLKTKLEHAEKSGKLPKVLIPVHMAGQSCDMAAIHALSTQYGFRIIEDASHAIGGKYQDLPIGDCRYSDITVFSFHPVKIITTGEGGMAVTNNAELAGQMQLLRSHAITRDESSMTHASDGPWYYQQIGLGFNYRVTDIQAALGLSQMSRLEGFVGRRREIAGIYDKEFAELPITTPWQRPDCDSAYHLYVIRLQTERVTPSHRQIFESLRAGGIGVNLHYIPVYRQPYYVQFGYHSEHFPEAERYYAEAISLPMYPAMTDDMQAQVIASLKHVLEI